MSVPSAMFGNIIGKRGATIKRIRADTDTKINVPNGHKSDEKLVVTGSSRQKVCRAARRINQIVVNGKKNMRPTHFVGIPMNISPIKEKFEEFQKLLTEDQRFLHIDKILYQESDLLHLTLDVFALLDTEERLKAVDTLQKCDEAVKKYIQEKCPDGKVRIHMKGIDIFSDDDASSVSVLFAKINPECKAIQDIANIVSAIFKEAGVSFEKRNNPMEVILHCTLMNSVFVKRADDGDDPNEKFKPRQKFNASLILEEFKDFDFGEIELSEIHISQMGTRGINGFYEASSILKFV